MARAQLLCVAGAGTRRVRDHRMRDSVARAGLPPIEKAGARIASRAEVVRLPHWSRAFPGERKDHRFYELVEDTLTESFRYGYLVIENGTDIRAIQPYFVLDQDLLAGLDGRGKAIVGAIRRLWPRFMRAKTLMIGCSAGEGHLDGDERSHAALAAQL